MNITKNSVVTMHYTLKNDEGTTLDSSIGKQPLVYIQGMGNLIPGLENALEGKIKGDKVNVRIEAKDAYGEKQEDYIQAVPRTEFENAADIEVGMQFQVSAGDQPMIVTVIEVKENEVILDGNHPLAGVPLNFDVEVMDLRAATDEEISHRHVHGPGGHHH